MEFKELVTTVMFKRLAKELSTWHLFFCMNRWAFLSEVVESVAFSGVGAYGVDLPPSKLSVHRQRKTISLE